MEALKEDELADSNAEDFREMEKGDERFRERKKRNQQRDLAA